MSVKYDFGDNVCEVCGEPATRCSRDCYLEYTMEGFAYRSPAPRIHYYCHDHYIGGDDINITSALNPRSINDLTP